MGFITMKNHHLGNICCDFPRIKQANPGIPAHISGKRFVCNAALETRKERVHLGGKTAWLRACSYWTLGGS